MQEEPQDSRRLFLKKGKQTGLIIVILAAVLLEGIAAFQYNYTRGMLERNLEKQVLIMLRASAFCPYYFPNGHRHRRPPGTLCRARLPAARKHPP